MFVTEIIFLISFIGFLYPYLIYPFILFVIRPHKNYDNFGVIDRPLSISAIIAARNEEAVLKEKITNTRAALEHYKRKNGLAYELIVTSDGSTDQTPELAKELGATVFHFPEGGGKELAQTKALKEAKGDIVLFTDAKALLDEDAITNALEYFNSERVGAVSSTDVVLNKSGEPAGEGAYVKFEMWLRTMESQILSIVGMSGSAFFVRRELVDSFAPNTCSDFASVLFCGFANKVAKHGANVVCRYHSISDESKEYSRKVRTVSRGMQTFLHYRYLLYAKHVKPLFRFLVTSHKSARWLSPLFFCFAFLSGLTIMLSGAVFLLIQFSMIALLTMAALGHFEPKLRSETIVKIPYFFVLTNVAMLDAMWKVLRGKKTASWSPSER